LSHVVSVVEKEAIPEEPIIIAGLPDIGLVGVIAAVHIASSLNMKDVGSVESDLLPPLVVLYNGLPKPPVRILSSGKLVVILSETAIPASAVYKVAHAIVQWALEKKAKLLVSIGGVAVEDRHSIDKPKVFASASDEATLDTVKGKGVEPLDKGYIVGPYALILRYSAMQNIPAISLLAEAFFNYPDPEAAASAITELNKILDLNVDVSKLREKGEEIRLASKDIMRRTQLEMAKMRKSQEYDVPPLHV